MRRLAGSLRLSDDKDTSNSMKGQRVDIEAWVTGHPGDKMVLWKEDPDVSGGAPIRERGSIQELFSPEEIDLWDGIIGSRLDRLFRDELDYLLWVRDVGDKYGKFVIDAEDGIDSSTESGRDILQDRARQAQKERRRIAKNRRKAANIIRQERRYNGGAIMFGLQKSPVRDKDTGKITGWELIEYAPYMTEARSWVARIFAGEAANAIVQDINARHVPTSQDAQRILAGQKPRGGHWEVSSFLKYLRSPNLKGFILHYPDAKKPNEYQVVRGPDGLPLRRPAVVDDETWDELQRIIGPLGQGRQYSRSANIVTLLLSVAFCELCSRTFYFSPKAGRKTDYYRCAGSLYHGCKARLVPQRELDGRMEAAIQAVADCPVIEVRRVQSNERDKRLKEVGAAIADLTAERFVQGIERPGYDDIMAELQEEHARLRATPEKPSEERRVPTGETVGQLWERLDTQGRRTFLLGTGLKLFVYRDWENQLHIRPELGERPRYIVVPLVEHLEAAAPIQLPGPRAVA